MKKMGDPRGLAKHIVRARVIDYQLSLALANGDHVWAEHLRALPLFRVAQVGRPAVMRIKKETKR